MKSRIFKLSALFASLFLGGCMLPRMFVAAFIPFQRFMIWGAAMAARYGAPLVMLMVDASPSAAPTLGPRDEMREPYYYDERIAPELLDANLLAKVYIIDYRQVGENDYAELLKEFASRGYGVSVAPLGGEEEALAAEEILSARGVETERGMPNKTVKNEMTGGKL
ncbi:hypothetical protein J6U76_02525 [bacterium]|nr:hypothetical protein [bacterium]